MGMEQLTKSYEAKNQPNGSYQLVACGAVGIACFAQGIELLLKAVCQARGMKEPRGNHQILGLYDQLNGCERFVENLETLFSAEGITDARLEARETVRTIEKAWMNARYWGLRAQTIEVPIPRKAGLLVFAVVVSFFGKWSDVVQEQLKLNIEMHFPVGTAGKRS